MGIEIYDVTKENYRDILKLQVAHSQKDFVESPYECLVDSVEQNEYRPVGLYAEGRLVGFAMYGFFPDEKKKGRLWIDRILIDADEQGKGFGEESMLVLIEKVTEVYGEQPIYLSVYPDNEGAIYLYKKLGFEFTNEKDINGEDIMRRD